MTAPQEERIMVSDMKTTRIITCHSLPANYASQRGLLAFPVKTM